MSCQMRDRLTAPQAGPNQSPTRRAARLARQGYRSQRIHNVGQIGGPFALCNPRLIAPRQKDVGDKVANRPNAEDPCQVSVVALTCRKAQIGAQEFDVNCANAWGCDIEKTELMEEPVAT